MNSIAQKFNLAVITFVFSLFIGTILPLVSQAQTFKTEAGHVQFHSTVPLHSFTGKSEHLVGKISLADSTVDFYVDVHTLKTGIGMRDNDMMETLNAEEYAFADFYGKLVTPFDPVSSQPQEVRVRGDFSVHGVKRAITIDGILQKNDEGLRIEAAWTLNMKNYDIKPPSILFYRVSKEVDISISATLSPVTN